MTRPLLLAVLGLATAALAACSPRPAASDPAPLELERTIPLPDVKGRIDHLAIDPKGGRLFVAALENGTLEAIDLRAGRVMRQVAGLPEPQGIAFLPDRDELVVAHGGDGSVRFFRAFDLQAAGQVDLGEDADNVRLDPTSGRVVVGYGAGAFAVIDPATRAVLSRSPLPAHPEGFQLDGTRAYVNLPGAGRIGVADLATGGLVASWENRGRRWNYPLAIDRTTGEVAVAYRLPSRLVVFDPATGNPKQALATCSDSDDLFFDAPRGRLYVACGDGHVDVFQRHDGAYAKVANIATASGARTALFSPDLDRLYVAAPARGERGAAILVLRPR